ncbi:uncharacterized protein LY89DRAFT_193282 [Mollisia scopiformis]|uniref:Uncharacterized protein n=1 Tax=Mollisia scopiformis TaxID=149040 RepID=A0A194WXU1_MOLSC|nr:uncharacterized protein LY89DRAFT_193282 [Mollisia scopiformis]KUJ12793.1 hypothetical protein LY89DRAFT_193282 [Mollisia scopiformis]
MPFLKKSEVAEDVRSFDAPPTEEHPAMRGSNKSNIVDSINLGLTVLALLSAMTIVGTSAETLQVYNTTRLGNGHFLSMWPNEFDIRPTVALVVCGSIMIVAAALGVVVKKVPAIANHTLLATPLSLLFPSISLVAALIATSFFYGVNTSSSTFSLQSWTCQWSDIDMDVKPHWGTLCKESKVALYLSVMMIPLQVLVLGTVVVGFLGRVRGWVAGKGKGNGGMEEERKGSPALS